MGPIRQPLCDDDDENVGSQTMTRRFAYVDDGEHSQLSSESSHPPAKKAVAMRVAGRYVVHTDRRAADGGLARAVDVSVHGPAVRMTARVIERTRYEQSLALSYTCMTSLTHAPILLSALWRYPLVGVVLEYDSERCCDLPMASPVHQLSVYHDLCECNNRGEFAHRAQNAHALFNKSHQANID